jgi:hypothetical protein
MAAVAMVVIEFSAGSLLRIEAEFGVGFPALDIASARGHEHHRDTKTQKKTTRDMNHKSGSLTCQYPNVG